MYQVLSTGRRPTRETPRESGSRLALSGFSAEAAMPLQCASNSDSRLHLLRGPVPSCCGSTHCPSVVAGPSRTRKSLLDTAPSGDGSVWFAGIWAAPTTTGVTPRRAIHQPGAPTEVGLPGDPFDPPPRRSPTVAPGGSRASRPGHSPDRSPSSGWEPTTTERGSSTEFGDLFSRACPSFPALWSRGSYTPVVPVTPVPYSPPHDVEHAEER